MSNIFKANNRFSILKEDKIQESTNKNNNSTSKSVNKNIDKKSTNNSVSNKPSNSLKGLDDLRKQEKIKKEDDKKLQINEENFPELGNSKNEVKINEGDTFIDKINNLLEEERLCREAEKSKLAPGWVEIKLDTSTRKIITNNIKKQNKTDYDDPYDVLDRLVFLHEKRTSEYIDMWGENDYESNFIFNNYDYFYFQRLDEKYEDEINKLNEYISDNENNITNSD
jgi:hypothetical protein